MNTETTKTPSVSDKVDELVRPFYCGSKRHAKIHTIDELIDALRSWRDGTDISEGVGGDTPVHFQIDFGNTAQPIYLRDGFGRDGKSVHWMFE